MSWGGGVGGEGRPWGQGGNVENEGHEEQDPSRLESTVPAPACLGPGSTPAPPSSGCPALGPLSQSLPPWGP